MLFLGHHKEAMSCVFVNLHVLKKSKELFTSNSKVKSKVIFLKIWFNIISVSTGELQTPG